MKKKYATHIANIRYKLNKYLPTHKNMNDS